MAPRPTPLAAIHDALCDAFTFESLGRMLKLKLNRDISDYSSRSDRQQVVFELLDRAHREGFLDDLVIAARQSNPGNEKLAVLPPTRGEELRHLSRLIEETEKKARLYSPLQGIAATGHAPVDAWEDDNLAPVTHQSRNREEKRESYDDVLAACDKVKRAALLGAPGSGKSTTLRKLAMDLARRAQKNDAEPLPVLVTLGNWRGNESLEQFLKHALGWDVQTLSKARRLVLLLDGLNEVPTATRAEKANDVLRLQGSIDPRTGIYVSCRADDYTGDLDLRLDTLTIEPLSPPRIRAALRQWVTNLGEAPEMGDAIFWQLAGDEQLAGVFERWAGKDEFWSADESLWFALKISHEDYELWRRHIPNPRSLIRLAANPFLLDMLFRVRWAEGTLPRNRGDLFGRFIHRLLSREKLFVEDPPKSKKWRLQPEGERLLEGLAGLAWRMQRAAETVVSRTVTIEALGGEELLKKALDSTLLEGDGELRFRHQLFQEYFAALALRGRLGSIPAVELWRAERWWERSGWEETVVLLAGLHAEDCTPVVRWLATAQPDVTAQCIAEGGAELADRQGLFRELQAAWLPRLTDIAVEPQPEGRAAIGRALGRLNLDNRKGVGVDSNGVPDIDWVKIPGGEIVYQVLWRRTVETFWMARHLVTNRQFQAFLDAKDGYRNDRWWNGLTEPDRTPRSPHWTEANHPRETMSWYEAMAFCAWLGYKLGCDVRLPTDCEWELAARGTEGRHYPWGNGYCAGYANVNESGELRDFRARTSAVGIYPEGASREGILDLAGNVWEWCLDEYGNPDRTQAGGTKSRVLRGGSWFTPPRLTVVVSHFSLPNVRGKDFGFRVVCSSPIRKTLSR